LQLRKVTRSVFCGCCSTGLILFKQTTAVRYFAVKHIDDEVSCRGVLIAYGESSVHREWYSSGGVVFLKGSCTLQGRFIVKGNSRRVYYSRKEDYFLGGS
jgi:hypothetical protein